MKAKEIRVISYGSTSIGRVRPKNEDAFLRDDFLRLYAVADGVGGQPAGEIASELAVKELLNFFKSYSPAAMDRSVATMHLALQAVNESVMARSRNDSACRGMATTLTACWLAGHKAVVGHVGDTQAFLLRGSKLRQITVEHTVAGELRSRGYSAHHPAMKTVLSHMLTQSIGPEPLRDPQVCEVPIAHGDTLVICSDGVTRHMFPNEITAVLKERFSPEQVVEELLRVADDRGGQDNATSVVIKIL